MRFKPVVGIKSMSTMKIQYNSAVHNCVTVFNQDCMSRKEDLLKSTASGEA